MMEILVRLWTVAGIAAGVCDRSLQDFCRNLLLLGAPIFAARVLRPAPVLAAGSPGDSTRRRL